MSRKAISVVGLIVFGAVVVGMFSSSNVSGQAKNTDGTPHLWTLECYDSTVFRINHATGETFILRDADAAHPHWVAIQERVNTSTTDGLWQAVLEDGKVVVDSAGKVVGVQVPATFKSENSELSGLDILVLINGQTVGSTAEIRRIIREARADKKTSVDVEYTRGDQRKKVSLKLPE